MRVGAPEVRVDKTNEGGRADTRSVARNQKLRRESHRSGGARGSYGGSSSTTRLQRCEHVTQTYILQLGGLDLSVEIGPLQHLVPSHTLRDERLSFSFSIYMIEYCLKVRKHTDP